MNSLHKKVHGSCSLTILVIILFPFCIFVVVNVVAKCC